MDFGKHYSQYDDVLLMQIFSTHLSCGAYLDILYLAEQSKAQSTAEDRIRAMFTATEATFWLLSHHHDLISRGTEKLGNMAKECHLYLKGVTDKLAGSGELDHRLHQCFRRWQQSMSRCLDLLHQVRHLLRPLRDIKCDDFLFYSAIQQLHQKGFGEIELCLDRVYALALYGNVREAKAGFPIPSDLACAIHEGARRRRVRRLLNDAGVAAPCWPPLKEKSLVSTTRYDTEQKSTKLSAIIRRAIQSRKRISEKVQAWLALKQGRNFQTPYHSISSSDTLCEKDTGATMKEEDLPSLICCPEC